MRAKLPYIMALMLLGTIIMCLAFMAGAGAESDRALNGAKFIYASD